MRCRRYKRVRSKFGGTVRRCASFSGSYRRRGKKGSSSRKGGRARKRSCKLWGVDKRGRPACLAYTKKGLIKRSGGSWSGKGARIFGPVRMSGDAPSSSWGAGPRLFR